MIFRHIGNFWFLIRRAIALHNRSWSPMIIWRPLFATRCACDVTSRTVAAAGTPPLVGQVQPPFQPTVQHHRQYQSGRHTVELGGVAHGAVQSERQCRARVLKEVTVGHWPVPVVRI